MNSRFRAGWYGRHITRLLSAGCHVKVFEKNDSVLSGASSFNQNRLHLGFHYPRSWETRLQSRRGYNLFKKYYSEFVTSIDMNIYLISSTESILDFPTYCMIMNGSRLDFEDVSNCLPVKIQNIDGAISCDECLINPFKAKDYFHKLLSGSLVCNSLITEHDLGSLSTNYDLVLDCTWNRVIESQHYFFEPCVVLVYRSSFHLNIALTFMDGNLFSLFPYVDDLCTLTHVKYTPLGKFDHLQDAVNCINGLSDADVSALRSKIETHVTSYFPSFPDFFEYQSYYTSIKTKRKIDQTDSRMTRIDHIVDNVYSVHSGKIDTIFDIEHKVVNLISAT